MNKLSTIQKRNNLNEVYVDPIAGPGGGHHCYTITRAEDRAERNVLGTMEK